MAKLTDAEAKTFLGKAYSLETQDQTNDHYDQDMENSGYTQPRRVADALAATGISKTTKILDVGCGTGLSGHALGQHGFTNIEGNDISQQMLDKALETGAYSQLAIADLNAAPIDRAGHPHSGHLDRRLGYKATKNLSLSLRSGH